VRIPESLMMSVSGVRGLLGEGMNPEVASRFTAAFARDLGRGMVVVGRDSRPSGPLIADAVDATLRFAGLAVVDLGIVSTPTVEIMVSELGASGGIVITASHNGPEWNALKFLDPLGEFLGAEEMERIIQLVRSGEPLHPVPGEFGALRRDDSGDAIHIKKILELPLMDREAVSAARFTAAVDCVNGAGSKIVPALLGTLGVDVVELNTDTDKPFPHNPEPRPEHLGDLAAAVARLGADIGFACDPDADRLVLVDETGRVLSEELTLAVAADFVLSRRKGPVVANMSTSRLLDWLGEKHGVPVHRTSVGEANVIAGMKDKGAVIGGEGNGGVIYPDLHYGRDAMVGIALVLQSLAESGMKLGETVSQMPQYHIVKEKVPFRGDLSEVDAALEGEFEGRIDRTDGMRIDMGSGWVHVRASNTEPVVRIIAEAASPEEARVLAQRADSILRTAVERER
jgi:phosphomannomutase